MKPEGITVSLFCLGATSKRNLDWSDGGATPSVILLLIGTKGGRRREAHFTLSALLRIKWCGSASGTLVIPAPKLALENVFDYGSYDDEQTWHRLKAAGFFGVCLFFTLSGGGGVRSPGEALENRVGPLVEGGELERLEGADGDTGKETGKTERIRRG